MQIKINTIGLLTIGITDLVSEMKENRKEKHMSMEKDEMHYKTNHNKS